jgi:hypothetical protein
MSRHLPFEAFLARIYTDAEARQRFLADPAGEAARAGLCAEDQAAALKIDRAGLRLAARSFAHKRARKGRGGNVRLPSLWGRWRQRLKRLLGMAAQR